MYIGVLCTSKRNSVDRHDAVKTLSSPYLCTLATSYRDVHVQCKCINMKKKEVEVPKCKLQTAVLT